MLGMGSSLGVERPHRRVHQARPPGQDRPRPTREQVVQECHRRTHRADRRRHHAQRAQVCLGRYDRVRPLQLWTPPTPPSVHSGSGCLLELPDPGLDPPVSSNGTATRRWSVLCDPCSVISGQVGDPVSVAMTHTQTVVNGGKNVPLLSVVTCSKTPV